jgi:hypothetical protein
MSLNIPNTQTQIDANIARIESKLSQSTPKTDKSFTNVMAVIQALQFTSIYKFAAERALQNYATTATGDDLDLIGNNYKVPRNIAIASQLTITIPAVTNTVIPVNTQFVGVANGVLYFSDAEVTAIASLATINVTAENLGISGNLQVGDELTIVNPMAGVENTATVTVELVTGTEKETDTNYRIRILDEIRKTSGGGNAANYRSWSQEVSGVARAYPYAGKPHDDPLADEPPDRTIYIEVTPDIDPDGIAPAGILTSVRTAITTDPITGESRQPLGLTDESLYVEPIYRTEIFIQISGLDVQAAIILQVQSDILTELTNYIKSVRPYIDGLDILAERNDVISSPSVSEVVQSVLSAVGGNCEAVGFGLVLGSTLPKYTAGQGETFKLVDVNYV